jgi:two-component system response regulator YesN
MSGGTAAVGSTGGYRLLVVDDEPVEREAVGVFAAGHGGFGRVDTAANGLEATEFAAAFRPDVIVLDIHMPGMDGLAAAAAIRAFDQRVRIVFLTAYGQLDYARRAFKLDADDFLLKPVLEAPFREAMDRALAALRQAEGDWPDEDFIPAGLERRLADAVRRGDAAAAASLVAAAFDAVRATEAALPGFRRAAGAVLRRLEAGLAAEFGGGLAADDGDRAAAVRRARSAREAADNLADAVVALARSAAAARQDPHRKAVAAALRLVDAAWPKAPSLEEVCRAAGLSRFHFSRVFREAVGRTFTDYLCGRRVDRAKELLADVSLPMKRICELCGFSDPAYFAGAFKKRVGLSPSEYRAMLPAGEEAKLLIKKQNS